MIEAPGIKAPGFAAAVVFAALAVTAPDATAAAAPIAAGARVRVLQSSSASPRARRCLTRLREELAAGGFEVTVSEFGAGDEALWMLDPPSPRGGSIATVTLIGSPDDGEAELWIVDGVPWGRVVIRRLLVPAGAGPHDDEVLAIRALEFLRASALELAGGGPPSPASATATPTNPSAPSPTSVMVAAEAARPAAAAPTLAARGPVSFEIGLSLLESAGSLGPAVLPVARLRVEWLSLLETRVTVAGFGTQPRVTGPGGTATVGHVVGLVELRAAFRHGRTVRPAVGVGGGFLRVDVEGAGEWPYEGTRGQQWTGLFDVGAGLTIRLGRQIAVAAELHGQLAAPYPTIRFSGEEVARIGRPALFSSLTLVTSL
jgi:hypothetical protein